MFYRLASNLKYKISTITAITHNQSYNTKGSDDINGHLISKMESRQTEALCYIIIIISFDTKGAYVNR